MVKRFFLVPHLRPNLVSENDYWLVSKPGFYQLFSMDGSTRVLDVKSVSPDLEIKGPWEVRFPFGWDAPQSTVFEKLISWPDSENDGIKHFSGIAVYHKTFELGENQVGDDKVLILDLGQVSEVADIYLNGKHLDVLWHAPYFVDISNAARKGKNQLVVEVANTWRNQMIRDALRPDNEKRTHTNITKGPNAWTTPLKDLPLLPSGLLGPVKIITKKRISR